jgi:hypothetical protein
LGTSGVQPKIMTRLFRLIEILLTSSPRSQYETGEFHLLIDYRSGEPEFRMLDAAGLAALRQCQVCCDPDTSHCQVSSIFTTLTPPYVH